MKFVKHLLLIVTLVITIAACASAGAEDEATVEPTAFAASPTPETTRPADNVLANTEWTLVSFGPAGTTTPVIEGTTLTLTFGPDGQAGGSGGCNTYGADYQIQDNTLVFGEIVSTLMACVEEGVTEQEQRYLGALRSAGEFEVTDDRLMLRYDNGRGVLNFVAAGSSAETPSSPPAGEENSLISTRWQLESFGPTAAETPVVAGSDISIEFETAVQVVGSGGCNSYGGGYVVQGDAISFDEIVRTEIACADQDVTVQEQRYFAALETAESFTQTADRLTILYDDGQSALNFVPASASGE